MGRRAQRDLRRGALRADADRLYIDGEHYEGDPRAIELTDQKVIVIVVGTPPAVIPSTADFSNA